MTRFMLWFRTIVYPTAAAYWDHQVVQTGAYTSLYALSSYVATVLSVVLVVLIHVEYWKEAKSTAIFKKNAQEYFDSQD